MELKTLFQADDDRAVSPVIGVILMVAITVILAAVIGTFVLGLGDQVQDTTPNTQIGIDIDEDTEEEDEIDITVRHRGGDRIEDGALDINVIAGENTASAPSEFADPFTVGDRETGSLDTSDGDIDEVTVEVIHRPTNSILREVTFDLDDEIDGLDDDSFEFNGA